MSNVKSAQAWAGLFVTRDGNGSLSAATTGPVGALYVNGTSDAASVTITGTNPYKFAVTLPTLTAGDSVSMYITATVAGVATASVVAEATGDTARVSDLPTAAQNAARVLDTETLDTGLTVRHGLELAAASVLNKLSGAGTGTEVIRNFSDTADLATVTVDGSGNKTAITYDFSI